MVEEWTGARGLREAREGGRGGRKQIELKLISINNTLISLWGEEREDKGVVARGVRQGRR